MNFILSYGISYVRNVKTITFYHMFELFVSKQRYNNCRDYIVSITLVTNVEMGRAKD